MPRPQKNRRICFPPIMQGFKPYGIAECESEQVFLYYDEYECFKLLNYENLSQIEAAEKMEVSQPTLTRIYNNALKKIANAFVEGKTILIEGGNFEFDKNWYKCKKCYKIIEGIGNQTKCSNCNCLGENELENLNKKN